VRVSKLKRYLLFAFALSIILVVGVPGIAAYSSSPNVDARVLEDVANGQVGQFLVVLKAQANARAAAARAPDRASRGQAVFGALRQIANSSQSSLRAQLDAMGVQYRAYWIVNLLALEGDQKVLDAILARSDVAAIESNRAFHVPLEQPTTPAARAPQAPESIEWNLTKVRAPDMWTLGFKGQGLVYANADTGVQWDHPALKPQYRGWNGTAADHNYNWWDAIHSDISGLAFNPCNSPSGGFVAAPASGSAVPCDDDGHGTHTMGIGVGDDGSGNQIGMAPGAKWIACRNMDHGVGRPSTYLECYQFFLAPTDLNGNNPDTSKRPDVVGNSYTCPIGPPPNGETCVTNSLQTGMDNMRAAGIFMAVSAGNSGSACSTISDPPSFYNSSITVGATDSGDNLAGFSSRGPITADGSNRLKPDLSAPGVSVKSSYPTNRYVSLSGTSMASPHVAGAVALLWSAVPTLAHNVDRTEFILEQSAVHYLSSQGCGGDSPYEWPNNAFGYGRIDVKAAYDLATYVSTPSTFYFPDIGRSNE
jgi:serine protease AprX